MSFRKESRENYQAVVNDLIDARVRLKHEKTAHAVTRKERDELQEFHDEVVDDIGLRDPGTARAAKAALDAKDINDFEAMTSPSGGMLLEDEWNTRNEARAAIAPNLNSMLSLAVTDESWRKKIVDSIVAYVKGTW